MTARTEPNPKYGWLSGRELSRFDCGNERDLTPDFSATGRLVKSDFQGEIGHEEVEIH